MANFNSLPKAIRERISELHLTQEEPISFKRYTELVGVDRHCRWGKRTMPALLQVSRKIEKEAAPFFYAKNHFEFSSLADIINFANLSWPRHRHLIRKFTVQWMQWDMAASECFSSLASMRNLEELFIRVDEQEMILNMVNKSNPHQTFGYGPPSTAQQNLTMLRHPGVVGLLKLRIPKVRFIELVDEWGLTGGPLPGGVLETIIAPKVMGSKTTEKRVNKGAFPFLSLSPELRNRIYDLLLRLDSPITPSPKEPSSASCRALGTDRTASALSILAVNRQIHDEAVGIFYHNNAFVFHHILHLNGFIQRLGSVRRSMIADITVYYEDFQRGGISLVDLTFDLLKSLTGLRKLEIIMSYQLITCRDWVRYASKPKLLKKANPCLLPGMKLLFELRGITNINVRDDGVTEIHEMSTPQKGNNFTAQKDLRNAEKLTQVMEHFDTALQQAQTGRINHALLEDKRWQMRDKFPELEDHEELTTENEVGK
ncbi:hypothetical protein KC343_g7820 [Hortaea werneckii]|uniref:F-box domain-containing protein n=1 Tax=Hortaea werneckii TaxID=91943 RepID=A0A3M7GSZ2_HORWE|nr:hypothetical protein KC352_g14285 [Hortaea werneckii]KAI7563973.1 hypothetical protein KC317_g7366 [Hortaea werneckii]KAI7617128.1 hypothetical protein KC346_g5646 [Hortaea werneckii]KAI7621942.1 hypothetical protein KC343_g7820 [Hortaea werneckii]KAI7655710.1 hypothetical protein KC319_g9927 [Hortaea werneckii]